MLIQQIILQEMNILDARSRVDSAISSINSAKAEIEALSRQATSQKSKDELSLAYNSLNDVINHCHTAIKFM
jgi:outer membrane protein TolC